MATKVAAPQSVMDRLRQYAQVREKLEHVQSLAGMKWGAKPMRAAAVAKFPEQALKDLRQHIDAASDPGIVPLGIRRIKEKFLPNPHFVSYCPSDRLRPVLRSPILQPLDVGRLETDLAPFGSNVEQLYALCVMECADQKTPGVFGENDDPVGHERDVASLTKQLADLVEDLRQNPGGPDDIVFGTAAVNGVTRRLGFHRVDGIDTQVPFGDSEALVDWAWQHRGQF
jgi:hypothetical protein